MNIVICCSEFKKKNGIDTIFNENKSIQVLATYTVLTENFAQKLKERCFPHILLVFDDVLVKGTTHENVIRDVLEIIPETRIVFCLSDSNREEYLRDFVLFLYNYQVYSTILVSKPLDRKAILNAILKPCTEEDMIKRFPQFLSDDSDDFFIDSATPIEAPLSDDEIERFYNQVYGSTMSSYNFEGIETRENHSHLYEDYETESFVQKICPSCSQLYMSKQNYCSSCGTLLVSVNSTQATEENVAEHTIPSSVATEGEDVNFNTNSLEEDSIDVSSDMSIAEDSALYGEESTSDASVTPTDVSSEYKYYCSSCDKYYMFGTICNSCGSVLESLIPENEDVKINTTEDSDNLDNAIVVAPNTSIEAVSAEDNTETEIIPVASSQIVTISQESVSEGEYKLFVVQVETEYDNYVAEIVGNITISVSKLPKAVGCTHIAIELAQTLKHSKYDCAVVFSDNETYEGFADYFAIDKASNSFEYDGITYYKPMGLYRAKGNHKVVVADMGQFDSLDNREFEASQIKVVVVDAGIWNIRHFEDFIKQDDALVSQIHYCVNFIGCQRYQSKIYAPLKNKGIYVYRIAESESALQPCKDNTNCYKRILSMLLDNKSKKKRKG